MKAEIFENLENFIILNFFEIVWNIWKFWNFMKIFKFVKKNWTLNFSFLKKYLKFNFFLILHESAIWLFMIFKFFENFQILWNFLTYWLAKSNFCAIKNHIALSCHVISFIDFARECNMIIYCTEIAFC